MKAGTSNNSIKDRQDDLSIPTRQELAVFYDGINAARNQAIPGQMPWVEAPRKLIEHLLRGNMNGFDDSHYFIYENVKVFEQGKKAEAERIERLTCEDKMHGGKS